MHCETGRGGGDAGNISRNLTERLTLFLGLDNNLQRASLPINALSELYYRQKRANCGYLLSETPALAPNKT